MSSFSNQSFAELPGLLIVFQDSSIYKDGKRDTDNEVAGIGVVSAFVAAASPTLILSVCAAMLDGASSTGGVLPIKVTTWLQRHAPQKIRSRKDSYRKVLDQTMIALADQQLPTGIAIVVSGYVRAVPTKDVFKPVRDPEASAASHRLLSEQAHDSSPESQDDDVELQSMKTSEGHESGRGSE